MGRRRNLLWRAREGGQAGRQASSQALATDERRTRRQAPAATARLLDLCTFLHPVAVRGRSRGRQLASGLHGCCSDALSLQQAPTLARRRDRPRTGHDAPPDATLEFARIKERRPSASRRLEVVPVCDHSASMQPGALRALGQPASAYERARRGPSVE
ncbi:hypothetical protein MAPG_06392 [Magnaporthiopsis poae ATCC 64411]|uniref:Uncharacterized protein n=1 Tax=Magnaporthiopsis poae (strain ATCC 64411 / 73-15) TaxID=644358 RepID=A0A0C4E1W8_MAGP6|nr:hypothetical protein MAPG_06392 [Magnaporthiopsis poae ATCC 64411]